MLVSHKLEAPTPAKGILPVLQLLQRIMQNVVVRIESQSSLILFDRQVESVLAFIEFAPVFIG